MIFKDRILNYAYKRQKWIEALAIFLIFLGVSFTFGIDETVWVWASYPYLAMLIAGFAIVLSVIWLRVEKSKVQNTIDTIHNKSGINEKTDLLTNRQQQVFDLILQKKTNKEISEELFIELSTLKTHINKIYKTLNISSRKEAKQFRK